MRILFATLISTLSFSVAFATNPVDTREYLEAFHRDPQKVMNEPLAKRDITGKIISQPPSLFQADDIESGRFVEIRDQIRVELCQRGGSSDCLRKYKSSGLAPLSEADAKKDPVQKFIESPLVLTKLSEMHRRGLSVSVLPVSPWSDSFWPIHKGATARRFADPGFPSSKDWATNHNYILGNPPWAISTNRLSPAEKYDLLVGDNQWRYSGAMWNNGKRYISQWGFVPSWTGFCHGWAPASFMYAEPKKIFTVQGYRGQQITFSPSDIKALASGLWAETPPIVVFLGRRCKKFNPREDEVGRVTDTDCFDTNPGSLHVGIVNRLGIQKKSFVFDSTFDWEVWNYPVAAYQYQYFNPQTMAVSKDLKSSVIPMESFTIDKFKNHRSPQATHVVGISLDLTYSIPRQPSTKETNKTANHHTVRYVYDLELNRSGEIIGGEWYSNFHPDFIWAPPAGSKALSKGEKKLEAPVAWDGQGPIPEALIQAAHQSSGSGQPVGAIIEALVRLSQPAPPPQPVVEPAPPVVAAPQ